MLFHVEQQFDLDVDKVNEPIVLIGWPGIALVAQLAVSSIKDSIGAEEFLNIEYFDFPPKSSVEDGCLQIPSAHVFYKSRESNDLFILTANFQPQSSKGVFEFSKKFCELMDEVISPKKIKMYISTGALVSDEMNDIPHVHVCGTDDELLKTFLDQENTTKMDSGIIAGANGILPAWAGTKGHAPGFCLLAETVPMPMMNLDPRASKAIVSLLRDYLKIDMNFEVLDDKISEMEDAFKSFKRQADQILGRSMEEPRGGPDSYFR